MIYASLKFYDVTGAVVAEINEHIMSMLDIKENQSFGDKFPAYITDTRAARVDVSIDKVVFKSGNVWDNVDNQRGVKVSPAAPVDIKPNLKEQFLQSTTGFNVQTNCRYEEFDNCMRCSCGFLNEKEATNCRNCGADFDNIRRCFSDGYLTERIYDDANKNMSGENISNLKAAVVLFEKISFYNDSLDKIKECKRKIEKIEADEAERVKIEAEKAEVARKEREAAIEKEKQRIKKRNKKIIVISSFSLVCIAVFVLAVTLIIPTINYNSAIRMMESGNYSDARTAFEALNGFKDSNNQIIKCNTAIAEEEENIKKETQYNSALELYNDGKYDEAITLFEKLNGYRDSNEQINKCNESIVDKINNEKFDSAVSLYKEGKYSQAINAFNDIIDYKDSQTLIEECWDNINEEKYNSAMSLYEEQKYREAIYSFSLIKDYRNSQEIIDECTNILCEEKYSEALGFYNNKDYGKAAVLFSELNNYKDADELWRISWDFAKPDVSSGRQTISAGQEHIIALKSNGTVIATGKNSDKQCDTTSWTGIIAVSAGDYHSVGLKSDGTVIATGKNNSGQCDVSGWRDIVSISAGSFYTLGLKKDGTVVVAGDPYNKDKISEWKDIIAISIDGFSVGLKSDGTVVSTIDEITTKNWKNIIAVDIADDHVVALRSDGTVLYSYSTSEYLKTGVFSTWSDIVKISGSQYTVLGLKSDGTVVATGKNQYEQLTNIKDWNNIVSISAGFVNSVGLKNNGSIVCIGGDYYGEASAASKWTNIKLPN